MGWWVDFKRVWNTPAEPDREQSECSTCNGRRWIIWNNPPTVDCPVCVDPESEFAQSVNAALKTWDALPDDERTTEKFQDLAGRRRN